MMSSNLIRYAIKIFALFFISALLVIVPLKVLSYGWSPNYGMILSSSLTQNNDLPFTKDLIEESIKENTPLYTKAKEINLIYIVIISFVLFNLAGLLYSHHPTAWLIAMSLLMLSNGSFIMRLLNSSLQLYLCVLIILIVTIFQNKINKKPFITIISFILYLALIRTIIPPEVYAMDSFNLSYKYINSLTFKELLPFIIENCWLFFYPFILWLISYKEKIRLLSLLEDPLFAISLLLQLVINFGFYDLALFRDTFVLLCFSNKFSRIIDSIESLKNLRVSISLFLYCFLAFFLLATHDGSGRYSRSSIETMPINFSLKELKNWAPEPGGVIYNDNQEFALAQFFENPNANYSYSYFNNFYLLPTEKNNILKIKTMLASKQTPLPEYYQIWVDQMSSRDRLITSAEIKGLENIAWLQCGRKLWIGKLKKTE